MIKHVLSSDEYIANSTDDISNLKVYEGTKLYLYDTEDKLVYHDGQWVNDNRSGGSSGGGNGVISNGSITTEMFSSDAKVPFSGVTDSVTSDGISDATVIGKSVMVAKDAAAIRTLIGAGTSSLAIGTSASTAKAGSYQPTSSNISDATTIGKSLLIATDAATARTAIGAGTSNLAIGTTSSTAKAGNYTPPNSTTSVAGLVKQAISQTDSQATTIEELLVDFNALLANLRSAGIIAS